MLVIYYTSSGLIHTISVTKGVRHTLGDLLPNKDLLGLKSVELPNDLIIDIPTHRIVTDDKGDYVGVERIDRSLIEPTTVDDDKINLEILHSDVETIKKVLDEVFDKKRLILYQIADKEGDNKLDYYFRLRGL